MMLSWLSPLGSFMMISKEKKYRLSSQSCAGQLILSWRTPSSTGHYATRWLGEPGDVHTRGTLSHPPLRIERWHWVGGEPSRTHERTSDYIIMIYILYKKYTVYIFDTLLPWRTQHGYVCSSNTYAQTHIKRRKEHWGRDYRKINKRWHNDWPKKMFFFTEIKKKKKQKRKWIL